MRATFWPSLALSGTWVFLQRYVFPGLTSTKQETNIMGQVAESSGTILVAALVGLPLATFGFAACQSLAAIFTHSALLGRLADPRELRERAWNRAPAAFAIALTIALRSTVGLLVALVTLIAGAVTTANTRDDNAAGGILAAIGVIGLIGGFFVMLWMLSDLAFAIPAAAVEGVDGKVARLRAKELMTGALGHPPALGAVWGVYGSSLVVWLAAFAGVGIGWEGLGIGDMLKSAVTSLPLGALWTGAVDAVPTVIIVWLIQAFACTALAVQYVERRVRIEGLDIEALAEEARHAARALD